MQMAEPLQRNQILRVNSARAVGECTYVWLLEATDEKEGHINGLLFWTNEPVAIGSRGAACAEDIQHTCVLESRSVGDSAKTALTHY